MRPSPRALLALGVLLGCALACAALHPRPHASQMQMPRPASAHLGGQVRRPSAANNYSPTMAYFETPKRPPRPIYEAQWDVEDFHTSGGYDAEITSVVNNAMLYAAASTPSPNATWIFDVDETSLSGYAEMLAIGFGYLPKQEHAWVLSASAPAIQQTLGLYQQLLEAGFKVVFLTGRKDTEHDATARNLEAVGYTGFDTLITRIPAEYNMTAAAYKEGRRTQLVEQEGYNIVGCIGDQWSDMFGSYTGFKVKLPNYMYFLP